MEKYFTSDLILQYSAINWWMIIATLEFIVIVILVLQFYKINTRNNSLKELKHDALNKEVDFNNIINSSFNSIQLYNLLKVRCHPDIYASNKELYYKAEKIFQKVTENKHNYQELHNIMKLAQRELDIKI